MLNFTKWKYFWPLSFRFGAEKAAFETCHHQMRLHVYTHKYKYIMFHSCSQFSNNTLCTCSASNTTCEHRRWHMCTLQLDTACRTKSELYNRNRKMHSLIISFITVSVCWKGDISGTVWIRYFGTFHNF